MIRLRLCGLELRLHCLILLALPLAARLGLGGELPAVLLALAFHEAAHLCMARALGVPVGRLDLMPFGGALELGNLYALGAGRLCAVALAGPLGNLLTLTAAAALAWAGLILETMAAPFARASLVLMLFNLLPALPLDGGRVLYAVLAPLIGERRSLNVGIALGAALGLLLIGTAVFGFLRGGRLNLTMLLAAVFLLASGAGERAARREGMSFALFGASRHQDRPHRLRVVALDADASLLIAARTLRAGEESLYALYRSGRFWRWLDQRSLLNALESGAAGEAVGRAALRFPVINTEEKLSYQSGAAGSHQSDF